MKPFFFRCLPSAHLRPGDYSGLAANDLSTRRARRVQRHLAACAACHAEWQAVQAVWQTTQAASSSLDAPDALRERIFAALPSPRPERKRFMPTALFARPLIGASLAVAALTTAVLVPALVYGPALVFHAPRAIAFADVEAAMTNIQTATWTEVDSIPNHKTQHYDVTEAANVWVRLDPPAELRKTTGYEGKPSGSRYLETERGTLAYTPGQNDYLLMDSGAGHAPSAAKLRNQIMHSLLFPRTEQGQSSVSNSGLDDDAPFKMRSTPWKSESVTLEGKPALRFSRHSVRFRDDDPWWKKQEKQEYNLMIYADPNTFRIMRRDWEQTAGVGGHRRTVSDHFRYNETPAPGTFEATPPPVGQPFLFMDTTKTGLYAKLPAAKKQEAEALVRRLALARNQKNWTAYAALRDFDYAPMQHALIGRQGVTPKKKQEAIHDIRRSPQTYRAELEKNFKSGKPYTLWRIDAVQRIGYGMDSVVVRKQETEPFPPVGPPREFELVADITGVTAAGRKEKKWASFIVTETDAGLRVAAIRFDTPRPPVRIKGGLSAEEFGRRAAFGGDFMVHPKAKTQTRKASRKASGQ